MERLLEGIRVVDCASFIAGPAAATIMGDFGADVIKVEPPGAGDAYRHLRDAPGNPPTEHNYAWTLDNRNKRGLALDLKQPQGREVLYRLIAQTDVFVTNTPLPARERLGITYPELKAVNERLIYASLTAYGEVGPEAPNTGFDSTALWARTSLMDMVRAAPDAPPVRSLPGMGDHPTAVSLYGAIMSALYRRERTGKGSYVHTSLMANGVWWNGIQIQAALSGATFERRPGREAATSALHNLYEARDGRWFHLVIIPEEKRWPALLDAIEQTQLASDPRFATREARQQNAKDLIAVLDEVFASADWAQWRQRLDAHGVTYGSVGTLAEVTEDEQMRAADILTPSDETQMGAPLLVNSPLWVDDTPKVTPTPAPALGEHNEQVLGEVGYDEVTIEQLRERGVLG